MERQQDISYQHQKVSSRLQSRQQHRCTNLHKLGALNAGIEISLRRGGVSSLEAHVWLSRQQKVSFLPYKTVKKVRSPPPLSPYSPIVLSYHYSRHITQSTSLSGLKCHLCGLHRGVRGGENAATLTGTLSSSIVVVGGSSGRVMSPVDSHDYHLGQLPFFSAYFPSFRPSNSFLVVFEATRPLSPPCLCIDAPCPGMGRH